MPRKTRPARRARSPLGLPTIAHEAEGAARIASATRFFDDAQATVKKGFFVNAVHEYALGYSYEGEATAHLWKGDGPRPKALAALIDLRDRTEHVVLQRCVVSGRPKRK